MKRRIGSGGESEWEWILSDFVAEKILALLEERCVRVAVDFGEFRRNELQIIKITQRHFQFHGTFRHCHVHSHRREVS
jgi:hypothetical protein